MDKLGVFHANQTSTVKLVLRGHSKRTPKQKLVFNTDYRLIQVKGITECSKHSAILSTFIKLPYSIKTFVLSILKWSLKTGFTVCVLIHI